MGKARTVHVSLDLPQSVFLALRRDPVSFVSEMRLAAAVKWHEMHQISQAKAAEIAGLSRSEFLTAVARFVFTTVRCGASLLLCSWI
jgi:predicted HTH domain antitoxin